MNDKEKIKENLTKNIIKSSALKQFESEQKSKRKEKRLGLIRTLLFIISGGLFLSLLTTFIFFNENANTPPELIVLNTILGSSLTTLIGVIAGTSID